MISLMISRVKHLAKLMFSLLSHGVETGDDSKSAAFSLSRRGHGLRVERGMFAIVIRAGHC